MTLAVRYGELTKVAKQAQIATNGGDFVLVFTCEHGGNRIPEAYRELFQFHQSLLNSHRGYDYGALKMAKTLATTFSAPLVAATVSRLLVDLNRSVGNPRLYSEATRLTDTALRQQILKDYYRPYRAQVEALVNQSIAKHGRVLHLSSHSFTPELNGEVRNADIGLLYDPRRPGEVALCKQWKAAFKVCAPGLCIRRNYPYAGKNDGLTSWFRKRLSAKAYVGIELEINQKHIIGAGRQWTALRKVIVDSLRMALATRWMDFSP